MKMDVGEKLVEIIQISVGGCARNWAEIIADGLIAHSVTLQAEGEWIPVSEKLPENFVSVLGYMPEAKPFPTVRECYTVDTEFYFPALLKTCPVSHWKPMPEPPKNPVAKSKARCQYLGSGPLEGRCMATKDTKPCVGHGACRVYKPERTPLEGDVLLEDMAVFSSAQQAAERRGEEAFTCPLCGGTAWWGRSKTNGHLHCGCNDCHFKLME